ncbi:peptidoglycan D,D-transpeptidase FtsI family protein [Pseudolysinimonas sp.]|jgi:peptidoglycan glycosyltransferase|uniref:peptidoglycan D,D-transpeptidase FtsI family protein n=1 Tax=Pseudolysinimonas sp. TaxID=2680009 RepID=UPI00378365CE
MNKQLRRVSTLVLGMFLALFVSTTIIQYFQKPNLDADGRNARTLYESFRTERGQILVDGQPIASSVLSDDRYVYQRVYANGPLYSAVTGYFTVQPSFGGLEGDLNSYLSGGSDAQFLDRINAILTGRDPQGASVELTIDPIVQQAAWDALGDRTGAVVAIDPSTGAILAMVSKPTYDPNSLAVHDPDLVESTYAGLLADPADPLIDRGIAGDLNPPGSTFKLVVAAAALESGQFTADSSFPNPISIDLPGTSTAIGNSADSNCGGAETASIATALRLSCNIPFAQLAGALGDDAIREQAEEFGFGTSFDIPMPSEPSQYPRTQDEAETWLSGFGQANVRASPLQMAMVSAAIANGGSLMAPTLVESIVAPDLSVLESLRPEEFSRPLSPENAAIMTQMMVDGVANGVANNARISGVAVAGKTGTAENGDGEPYTVWFTGFAPADNPRVAIAVVLEDSPCCGNSLAAPIAREVMEAVLSR